MHIARFCTRIVPPAGEPFVIAAAFLAALPLICGVATNARADDDATLVAPASGRAAEDEPDDAASPAPVVTGRDLSTFSMHADNRAVPDLFDPDPLRPGQRQARADVLFLPIDKTSPDRDRQIWLGYCAPRARFYIWFLHDGPGA